MCDILTASVSEPDPGQPVPHAKDEGGSGSLTLAVRMCLGKTDPAIDA